MVLDPIPQSLPVHFFGSRPQPPTSRKARYNGGGLTLATECTLHPKRSMSNNLLVMVDPLLGGCVETFLVDFATRGPKQSTEPETASL